MRNLSPQMNGNSSESFFNETYDSKFGNHFKIDLKQQQENALLEVQFHQDILEEDLKRYDTLADRQENNE